MTFPNTREYEHPNPGRLDVNGVEWWACDPYPTWFRWEHSEDGSRSVLRTNPAAWLVGDADEIRTAYGDRRSAIHPDSDPDVRQVKQVIVMRTDLQMRKGKMVAQGAHASMVWMIEMWKDDRRITDEEHAWISGPFTKVCVRVDSMLDLDNVHRMALDDGLTVHMITDSGKTEFHGVPTPTCLAIGPNWADDIDNVTGDLKLL